MKFAFTLSLKKSLRSLYMLLLISLLLPLSLRCVTNVVKKNPIYLFIHLFVYLLKLVFLSRWKAGVAASLNYVPLTPANKTASLIPYPDWKANTLPKGEEKSVENGIISTFRVKVDACDRLWVMDTGLADILGSPNLVSPPAIVIFDLNTDKLIRRYTLKESDLKGDDSFFANIVSML